jgi:hypothetical protein
MKEAFNMKQFQKVYHKNEKEAINYLENIVDKRTISWREISALKRSLSRSFIKKYIHKLDMYYLCIYQNLSESLIKENLHRLNIIYGNCWAAISQNQILSESFMEEFKEKIHWPSISRCQKMSLDFLTKNKERITLENLYKNNKTDRYIKLKFQQYIKLIK